MTPAPDISQEAARAMLAALKNALQWHDQLKKSDLEKMRRAIALAEGRAS